MRHIRNLPQPLLAWTVAALALLGLWGPMPPAWGHPSDAPAHATTQPTTPSRPSRWGASYFPNLPLVTHDGTPVRFYDDLLKGKIVLINFFYTACQDACPLETARLVQVQKLLGSRVGRDIFMYSISIDPDHDTPAVLAQYRDRFQAGPGWVFLTGQRADIDQLRTKLGVTPEAPAAKATHNLSLILGNEATGRWMKRSPMENPQFIAVQLGQWLSNWQGTQAGKQYAEAPRLAPLSQGQYLFQTRCAACHTLGQGDGVGPDLAGVTQQRERGWLERWLTAPDKMLAEGDPLALALFAQYKQVPMPNLHLSESDVAALLAYLEMYPARPLAPAQPSPPMARD
jgi:protein SCO1